MPRLFIGIKIIPAESLKDSFHELKGNLTQSSIKWVETENFHLTLRFLGNVDKASMESLISLLGKIAVENSAFTLESAEFGYFGKKKHPRVIWYAFKPDTNLLLLQSSIEESLTKMGVEKEEKHYSPHLTLGRVKNLSIRENLEEILSNLHTIAEKYPVTKFSLIESTLTPKGSVYTVLQDFYLMDN
jgi:2'-5' RNA ligase